MRSSEEEGGRVREAIFEQRRWERAWTLVLAPALLSLSRRWRTERCMIPKSAHGIRSWREGSRSSSERPVTELRHHLHRHLPLYNPIKYARKCVHKAANPRGAFMHSSKVCTRLPLGKRATFSSQKPMARFQVKTPRCRSKSFVSVFRVQASSAHVIAATIPHTKAKGLLAPSI